MRTFFQHIQDFLGAPYLKSYSWKRNFRISLSVGIFVALFLLTFQPFGLGRSDFPYKTIFILGFGLVTFVISLIYEFTLFLLLRKKEFRIWQKIILEMGLVAGIASGNYSYLILWMQGRYDSGINFGTMLLATILVGLFPIAFSMWFQYLRINSIQQQLNQAPSPAQVPIVSVKLYSDQTKDYFESSTEDLLYLEANDNYTALIYIENQSIQKKLL
ncbi:MAG: hypothetical protein AAFU64_08590, partial [Bacteroidota bacterium]